MTTLCRGRIGFLGWLIPLALAVSAWGHNLDQRMTYMAFDDATLEVISARASANDLPLIRKDDVISILLKTTPGAGTDTGVGFLARGCV
jgi:hypothetical protein